MAFTSGTASDYLDLLNRLKTFVTQDMLPASERWTVVRWIPGPPAELVLSGPGLSGTDEILVGIKSETDGITKWNWKLRGFVTFNGALGFDSQFNASPAHYASLHDFAIPYWIVASGRRIVLVAKIAMYYEAIYLGFFLPYATPGQYPYPMCVAGSNILNAPWTDPDRSHGIMGGASVLDPGGVWQSPSMLPNARTHVPCPDGTYPLLPILPNGMGEMDGCYYVSGRLNAPENIITAAGVDHLVVPNVHRVEDDDFWALRLS